MTLSMSMTLRTLPHRTPGLRGLLALAATLALACAPAVQAQTGISVEQPYVRATVPQQKSSGAFLTLRAAQDARLVAASSPVAGRVEIHEMKMEGDVMKMRQVPSVALPAGQTVQLAPGGYHLMLLDLKQPLQAGDNVPLTLTIATGNGPGGTTRQVEVSAPVRPLGGGTPAAPAHGHSH
ncbi:MAG: copper chaperone PCu(A)C [Comamonas sp.]